MFKAKSLNMFKKISIFLIFSVITGYSVVQAQSVSKSNPHEHNKKNTSSHCDTNAEKDSGCKDKDGASMSMGCCSKAGDKEVKMEKKATSSLKVWNKVCPVLGNKVDTEVKPAEYKGKLYGFCCPGCDEKFKSDPEKYSKNLSSDGKSLVKK